MIVKEIDGDLFETEHEFIAHGCNSQGVMGSGIAAVVRDKFPKTFEQYKAYCVANDRRNILGTLVFREAPENDKIIINCITQQYFGTFLRRYVSYCGVADCFERINNIYKGKAVAVPRIGAGRGGGNWRILSTIINEMTPDVDIYVYFQEEK